MIYKDEKIKEYCDNISEVLEKKYNHGTCTTKELITSSTVAYKIGLHHSEKYMLNLLLGFAEWIGTNEYTCQFGQWFDKDNHAFDLNTEHMFFNYLDEKHKDWKK
jgi:hypothetical protein